MVPLRSSVASAAAPATAPPTPFLTIAPATAPEIATAPPANDADTPTPETCTSVEATDVTYSMPDECASESSMRARTVVLTVLSALTAPNDSPTPTAPTATLTATASPVESTSVSSDALTVSVPACASTSEPDSIRAWVVLEAVTCASEPAPDAETAPSAPETPMPTDTAWEWTSPSERALTVMLPVVESASVPLTRAVVVVA